MSSELSTGLLSSREFGECQRKFSSQVNIMVKNECLEFGFVSYDRTKALLYLLHITQARIEYPLSKLVQLQFMC